MPRQDAGDTRRAHVLFCRRWTIAVCMPVGQSSLDHRLSVAHERLRDLSDLLGGTIDRRLGLLSRACSQTPAQVTSDATSRVHPFDMGVRYMC